MDESFDPYRKWLGIRAVGRPLSHYQLLGLEPFEDDAETISHAADQRMSYVRTLAVGDYIGDTQKLLNELAAAKVCLLNPDKKVAYDERLSGDTSMTQIPPVPPLAVAHRPPKPPPVLVQPPAVQPSRAWPTSTNASAVTAHAARLRRRPTWFVPVAAFFASATLVPILAFLLFGGGNDSELAPAVAPFSPEEVKRHQNAAPIDGTSRFLQAVELTAEGRPLEVGKRAVTRLVDWDADGKLDLLVGAGDGYVWIFKNVGSTTEFRLAPGERVKDGQADLRAGTEYTTACFVDMTGDGKSDLIVADSVNRVRMFFNRGTSALPNFNGFSTIPDPNLNRDGQPDVAYGINWGYVKFYISDPAHQRPSAFAFRDPAVRLGNLDLRAIAGDDTTPTFGDVNSDGALDLISGGLKGKLWLMLGIPNDRGDSSAATIAPAPTGAQPAPKTRADRTLDDVDRRWLNELYNTTVRDTGKMVWEEVDNRTGQILYVDNEVARTIDYIEIFCPKRNYHIRLLKESMELLKDGKWGWVAHGRWETR